jgi:tetratricopeptide (TPR) repeat protein
MKSSQPFLSFFLAALCFTSSSVAQVTGKPQRKPGLVVVDTDDPCYLTVDGTDEGVISPTATKKLEVSVGEHILKCTIKEIPDLVWRKLVDVKNSDQVAAIISLKALHMQYERATSQRQKQNNRVGQTVGRNTADAISQPAKAGATTANSQSKAEPGPGFQRNQGAAFSGAEAGAISAASMAEAKAAAMKVHFDAGLTALEQAEQVRTEVDKLPWDQQANMRGQLDQATGTAVTELKTALEGIPETDVNRNVILAKLGEAYEVGDKYADAVSAYQKAVALEPDPFYYNRLGNSLARIGRLDDALAAYRKATELDPGNAALYWRNFAIGLYNSGRIKESIEPLKKATEADPNNAQAWYVLGAALVNMMEFKQEGDKLVPVMQLGTIEAYQKAIGLDPNGPWGAQAKRGLQALQAMGLNIGSR